jgi:asparagine synthase (glutamine-hydrolysing)
LKILSYKKCIELIPKILSSLDEPIADPSIIPTYLLSEFTRKNVKVALSGDGGDEVFAGYPKYYAHKFAICFDALPKIIREKIGRISNFLPIAQRKKQFLLGLKYPPYIRNQIWIAHFMPQELKKLIYYKDFNDEDSVFKELDLYYNKLKEVNLINQMMYLDIKMTLQDLYLVKVDRASMFCSLEVRAPFLDRELIEFGASLPVNFKLRGITTKYILRKIAEKYLPKGIIYRAKRGFGIPLKEWLLKELRSFVVFNLSQKKINHYGIFKYEQINKILDEFYKGRKDSYIKIWNLLNFQIWLNNWY